MTFSLFFKFLAKLPLSTIFTGYLYFPIKNLSNHPKITHIQATNGFFLDISVPLWWLFYFSTVFHLCRDILYSICFFRKITRTLILFFFNCSGFCHTLKWISHGFTCVPHPDPPSHLPLHPDPSRSSQCTRSERLSHASNLGWWSVSP